MAVWIWLGLLILFILAEAATVVLVSIWFAGGALVGMLLAALHAPVWLQVLGALAASAVLLCFTRPVAMKHFNRSRVKTNVEDLKGKQAIVTSEINNLMGVGQVIVGGQEWSARNAVENEVIPEGMVVTIEQIKGVKLIVKSVEPDM